MMKKLKLRKKKEQNTLEDLDRSKETPPAPRSPRGLTRWLLLGGILGVAGIATWALLPSGGQRRAAPAIAQPLPPAEPPPSSPTITLIPETPATSTPSSPTVTPNPEPSTPSTPSSPSVEVGKNPFRSLEAKTKPPREASASTPGIPAPSLPLPPIPTPMTATPPPPQPTAKLLGLVGGERAVAVLVVGNQTYYARVGEEVQGLGKLIEVKDRCATTEDRKRRTQLCTEEQ